MRIYFEDDDLEELFITGNNKKYKVYARDKKFMEGVSRVYTTLMTTSTAPELKQFSFLHYERLRHIGLSSVRILNNRVERLLFREMEDGICITIIELNETHYGNKK
ncbi:MAG: hypothetical protein LUB83_04020 [Prevotellaceae bacterium]|nr:hypothetical protein [Prevotellaceae bacterium]